MTHPARPASNSPAPLTPLRIERRSPMLLLGYQGSFTGETMHQIPELWGRLAPQFGRIPGEIEGVAYGVCLRPAPGANGIEYLAAVEVLDLEQAPAEMQRLSLPALTYAVFPHHGHVSTLSHTIDAIQTTWLQQPGGGTYSNTPDAPAFFERYGPAYDPVAGKGDVEIWFPIEDPAHTTPR